MATEGPQVAPYVCPQCKNVCQALIPQHNPVGAAEHYCGACHKSYPVPEAGEAARELERQARRNRQP
jgi:hypothetical protein